MTHLKFGQRSPLGQSLFQINICQLQSNRPNQKSCIENVGVVYCALNGQSHSSCARIGSKIERGVVLFTRFSRVRDIRATGHTLGLTRILVIGRLRTSESYRIAAPLLISLSSTYSRVVGPKHLIYSVYIDHKDQLFCPS